VATAAALVATGAVVRLTTDSGEREPGSAQQSAEQSAEQSPRQSARGRLEGCGPLTAGEVHGRRANHLPGRLTRFWGDEAVCRGMWLGGRSGRFVPQGLAVDGRTGWVTGYDGGAAAGQRACRLLKIDLRRLEVVAATSRIEGAVKGRRATYCRHGGAVVADGPKRLWVVETRRLWLLDPRKVGRSDPVRRVWRLEDGVRGSVGVLVPGRGPGRGLGLGRAARPGRLDWFDPQAIRRPGVTTLRASRTVRAPGGLQGLAWGRLRADGRNGVWHTRSGSGCGILVGPRGQALPVLPGAEGIGFDDRNGLWMLSESSVRLYYGRGRPVVPQLVRYSVATLADQVGLPGGERTVRECLKRFRR
jgi:hypothetical protein